MKLVLAGALALPRKRFRQSPGKQPVQGRFYQRRMQGLLQMPPAASAKSHLPIAARRRDFCPVARSNTLIKLEHDLVMGGTM